LVSAVLAIYDDYEPILDDLSDNYPVSPDNHPLPYNQAIFFKLSDYHPLLYELSDNHPNAVLSDNHPILYELSDNHPIHYVYLSSKADDLPTHDDSVSAYNQSIFFKLSDHHPLLYELSDHHLNAILSDHHPILYQLSDHSNAVLSDYHPILYQLSDHHPVHHVYLSS